MKLSRRQLLAASAPAAVSLCGLSPRCLSWAAEQAQRTDRDRILVVLQLSGGNDGLNTVIPYRHDTYRKARPTLAISRNDVLDIDGEVGFHPAAQGFRQLLEDQQLAIVHGVGYPNPNRSHFESMDIWHTCLRKSDDRPDGWLGRTVDQVQSQQQLDVPALHLGHRKQPYALVSQTHRVPSVKSLDQFRLELNRSDALSTIRENVLENRTSSSPLLDFVQTSTSTAIDVSRQLQNSIREYEPAVSYPDSQLAREFKTVAQLINANLSTRVYYLELDGFDTHASQADAHAILLKTVGDALAAFQADLSSHGHADRVTTFCFSEFGRRVAENASKGTDHGTAAPVFLVGSQVQAGFIGQLPNLDKLENGDLLHQTDFRQIYSGILQDWLQVDPQAILPGRHTPVQMFRV